ncbi:MAG: hypothetical protein WC455_29895 [Dehalococcoidia bacterium]|jgi:hypothetical protein
MQSVTILDEHGKPLVAIKKQPNGGYDVKWAPGLGHLSARVRDGKGLHLMFRAEARTNQ